MESASCAIQERVASISLRFRASEVHLTEHRLPKMAKQSAVSRVDRGTMKTYGIPSSVSLTRQTRLTNYTSRCLPLSQSSTRVRLPTIHRP